MVGFCIGVVLGFCVALVVLAICTAGKDDK